MRLGTIQTTAGPRAVALRPDAEDLVDLHATDAAVPPSVKGILAGGAAALAAAQKAADSANAVKLPMAGAKMLPPVTDPEKILCVGLNYRDHAIEGGKAIPDEPVLFGKYNNALIAHGDEIRLPKVSDKVDYEAELVIVIGKAGRDITEAAAMGHVAGYCPGHDVSARDWQFRGEEKQWMIGKTFDTFAPVGPFITTGDQAGDPHDMRIRLRLNGETMQDSSTKEFIFKVPQVVAFLSQVFTLKPGDLIFTGTPPGVGAARKPPVYLKPGDVTEVEIERLGVLRNSCVAA